MQGLGLLILIVGLVLHWRTPVVVLLAAVVTGLCSGMTPLQLLDLLGKAFVDNRILTLFLLTLPAVGLCEKYGLREKAAHWVAFLGSQSGPGRTLWSYQVFRVLCGLGSLRLNGHPTLVRPLLAPMADRLHPSGHSCGFTFVPGHGLGFVARRADGDGGGVVAIIPAGSLFWLVVANCAAMTILSALTGNSFASFPVISQGILIPLLLKPTGADASALGILTLAVGASGTLISPMAANFNLVPAALLELKDPWAVSRTQWKMSALLWVAQVILMWWLVKGGGS